jgi:hypothetical protein
MNDLHTEAEKLLEQMALVPPREPGEQLRPIDEATILELSDAGKPQAEIAERIGCHQSTVSRTLAEWKDSRGPARKYAEAKSLEMMKRFVTEASPADILKMQAKLDVIREDREAQAGNNIVVMVGTCGTPLEPPILTLSPAQPAIDATAVVADRDADDSEDRTKGVV